MSKLTNYPMVRKLKLIKKGKEETVITRKADNIKITLEDGAALTYILIAAKGWAGKPLIEFELAGRGSSVNFLGFIAGGKTDEFDFNIIMRHNAPKTRSRQDIRAVMSDRSMIDFSGNIIIEKEAKLADAQMSHRTLLMSPFARARTLPSLEIKAADVKAKHAATAGKADKEMSYYLESRGLNQTQAQQLLVAAFFESQLALIDDPAGREQVRRMLEKSGAGHNKILLTSANA